MASIDAYHLENTRSRNAYWRAYVIEPRSGRPFWITHWGAMSTAGQFQVHHDGHGSHTAALEKRDEKVWQRGYTEVAHQSWTLHDELADQLARYSGRQACEGPFWTLARGFTTAIAGGEPLDEIYAALREMIDELAT